ncbi:MAG: V-type ATP synthase subunit E family protein [bacterium]|nr:V-type ATP synthase subunit E family protein [bacterium]
MSLDAIIAKIASDADARVAEIQSAAKAKNAEILAEVEKRAHALEARIREAGEREAAGTRERVVSMAALNARKAVLAAKQELLDEAFAAAADELETLKKDAWRAVFKYLVADTDLKGPYEVITSKREAAFLDDAFLKGFTPKLSVSNQTREQGGGFVLRGGKTELNFTFRALTRSLRPFLEKELLGILGFEELR